MKWKNKIITLIVFMFCFSLSIRTLQVSAADYYVATEEELKEAVINATSGDTITLTADIELTDPMDGPFRIPAGKDITLAGNFKLIGAAEGWSTIDVHGSLTLDGPIVTHKTGVSGRGILLNNSSSLTILDGEITGNTGDDWGIGIHSGSSQPYPTITIAGGKISNNITTGHGGGIHTYGDVIITGGEISGNSAVLGGGVYSSGGTITISGGEIFDNIATSEPGASGGGAGLRADNIIMTGGKIYDNEAQYGGGVYANNKFDMSGGEIFQNIVTVSGGGIYGKTVNISGDAKIYENQAVHGGGISILSSGIINIDGGEIFDNTANYGGGLRGNSITMSAGKVYGNRANNYGGGIYNGGNFTMSGGEIYDNQASSFGGGVYNAVTFTMSEGLVFFNAANYGGGVFNAGTFDMQGGSIKTNLAAVPDNDEFSSGGGVYTIDYAKLTVSENAIFSNNIATFGYAERDEADDSIYNANILGTTWTTPFEQGYNNYDINYRRTDSKVYTVTFIKNDGTEDIVDVVTVPAGEAVGEAMPEEPVWTGYDFDGWNMSSDGTGSEFSSSNPVTAVTFVYAQWIISKYDVTYHSNYGIGEVYSGTDDLDLNINSKYTVKSYVVTGLPDYDNHTFIGWSTNQNATESEYEVGEEFEITEDTTLYAVWKTVPAVPTIPQTTTPSTGVDNSIMLYLIGLVISGGLLLYSRKVKDTK